MGWYPILTKIPAAFENQQSGDLITVLIVLASAGAGCRA
jgi:hypothetical protein